MNHPHHLHIPLPGSPMSHPLAQSQSQSHSQKRGPWSPREDDLLMSLVRGQGALNWVRISQALGSRTPKQCRERYHQNLKPSLNHEPITPEEGRRIEELVGELGKKWAEIARRLPGRSDNAVKNWWNGSQNRRKRQDRRKNSQLHYDDNRVGMSQHYAATAHMETPRTLPRPDSRHLPPPLHFGSETHSYYPEPPLSPAACSPQSELAPSLMSDCGSNYSTSPHSFSARAPDLKLELAPLKLGAHISPRGSPSPSHQHKLPPITTLTPLAHGHSPYLTSPPVAMEPHSSHYSPDGGYFPYQRGPAYPTAPNSPQLPSPQLHPNREERSSKVDISNLVQSSQELYPRGEIPYMARRGHH